MHDEAACINLSFSFEIIMIKFIIYQLYCTVV